MPKLFRNISTTYSPEYLFDLVADIEAYPEFLPYCTAARIINKQDNLIMPSFTSFPTEALETIGIVDFKTPNANVTSEMTHLIIAELMIQYKIFRSAYTSRVTLYPKNKITVELVDGPFKHLMNHWKFIKEANGSKIEFMLDFELKSSLLENLISSKFNYYTDKLMAAFINRASNNLVNKL